ncbi:uncharacterized protein LOC111863132 [Cryptotermes secundus]|uniref:uncharacterized protein LOC111863132 n=1 Tax=Cryptotermes secundus TaxID=105785 RepID=UPI000CD7DE98|nr:uncharacterized protein LOC111863132 [Cryptotermes secundus]
MHRVNMDCSKLLVILVSSSVAVTGFQPNYSPDGFKLDDVVNTGSEKALLSRLTRDVDVQLRDTADSCCNLPNSSRNQETEKYRTECRDEVGFKFGVRVTEENVSFRQKSNETVCYVECLLRKKNEIDDAGRINMKSVTESVLKFSGIKDPSTIDKISTTCGQSTEGNGDAPEGTYLCNTAGFNFLKCAYNVTIFNCPTEHQVKSETCNRFRDQLKVRSQ